MKKYFFCILLIAFYVRVSAQQPLPFKRFFTTLKVAAGNKDVAKLKTLIYPFRDEVEDMQAAMIESILNNNESARGDGAFSIRALDTLITSHLDQITIIDKDLYRQLSGDLFFGKVINAYSPKNVFVMNYQNTRMILLKEKKGLQLLFWENLNKLLH